MTVVVSLNFLSKSKPVQGLVCCELHRRRGSVRIVLSTGIASKPPPPLLPSHACRGCTCVEQSVLGGVAHLLSFDGTGGWVVGSGGRERRACGRCLGG